MMLGEAFKMGSYGVYVWSCYGLTLVGLLFMVIAARRSWQTELKQARRRVEVARTTTEQSI